MYTGGREWGGRLECVGDVEGRWEWGEGGRL